MPRLQHLTAVHAPAVLAFERENRAYFAAAVGDRGDAFFAELDQRIAMLVDEQERGVGSYFVLVEGAEVLGRFNLVLHGGGVAELGYRVAERAAGRGLATTSVIEVCDRARELGVTTVRAATTDDNVASRRVLVKAGFAPVGPADPDELGGGTGTRWERAQSLISPDS